MTKKVAVIGAGITGLTIAYYLKKAGIPVKIFEKNNRAGGVIQSSLKDGFLYEHGPNSGTLSNIEIVQLLNELNSDIEIDIAQSASKKRLIWKNNRWEALPSGLWSAIRTPLFTFYDKLRVLGEPFRAPGTNPDETVAAMVKRRLGQSFLDYAIDPFISGIYAGDPDYLVTKYALPKLYTLEQTYGSFTKGAYKKAKQPKTALEKQVTKDIFSIKGGLENLVKALVKHIGDEHICLNRKNININYIKNKYFIDNQEFTHVISAVQAQALPKLLPFVPSNMWLDITNLRYAPVIEIGLGFKHWQGGDLKAFGGLVPMKEHKNILGLLFMSSIFKNRAPENGALFTLFIGGLKRPELIEMPKTKLLELVAKDFKQMMQLTDFNPDMQFVKSYKKAIAQYGADSSKRLKSIDDIEKTFPGLILAGSIRDGVGLADRVKQAKQISNALI